MYSASVVLVRCVSAYVNTVYASYCTDSDITDPFCSPIYGMAEEDVNIVTSGEILNVSSCLGPTHTEAPQDVSWKKPKMEASPFTNIV